MPKTIPSVPTAPLTICALGRFVLKNVVFLTTMNQPNNKTSDAEFRQNVTSIASKYSPSHFALKLIPANMKALNAAKPIASIVVSGLLVLVFLGLVTFILSVNNEEARADNDCAAEEDGPAGVVFPNDYIKPCRPDQPRII